MRSMCCLPSTKQSRGIQPSAGYRPTCSNFDGFPCVSNEPRSKAAETASSAFERNVWRYIHRSISYARGEVPSGVQEPVINHLICLLPFPGLMPIHVARTLTPS
jgi:hypothetical protein